MEPVIVDGAECIEPAAVISRLNDALGSSLRRIDVRIGLETVDASVILTITAAWRDEVWTDIESVAQIECGPAVEALIVDSIVRGTAEWRPRKSTVTRSLAVAVSAGPGPWPLGPQSHVGYAHGWGSGALTPSLVARAGVGAPLTGAAARVEASVDGDQTANSQIGTASLVFGPAVRFTGAARWTPQVAALAGSTLVWSAGLPLDELAVVPAIWIVPAVDYALSEKVSLHSEIAVSPLLVEVGTGQAHVETVPLAPIRLGLGVAFAL